MTQDVKLAITGKDGADIVIVDADNQIAHSDLVRASSEKKVRDAAETAVIGIGQVASIVLDLVEAFTKEASERKLQGRGKMVVRFGVAGGAKASLRLVSADANAFLNVDLEIPAS